MTVQEYVALAQARPFRAFRLHAASGVFSVAYPLGAALLPTGDAVALVEGDIVATLPLALIERGEAHGPPLPPEAAIAAVEPARLARDAQLLAAALAGATPAAPLDPPAPNPRAIELIGASGRKGIFVVHAAVSTRPGHTIFSTAGTRWNLHGLETFANGASLYLHHPEHPTVEQRIIIWPPDTGTFESFAEAMPLAALRRELERRDARLSRRPAKLMRPPAAWFHAIRPKYGRPPDDERTRRFGEEPDDFERFELRCSEATTREGRQVRQPRLLDTKAETVLFHLTGTAWSGTGERKGKEFAFALQDTGASGAVVRLIVNPRRLSARLAEGGQTWPLAFFQRALHNFALHEQWGFLRAALQAGPPGFREPDHVWPLPGDFRVELWSGDVRHPLPFLQPLILGPDNRLLLDLRTTAWGAIVHPVPGTPRVRLQLVSHEEKDRLADARLTLELDLVAHRATCTGCEGATSLGMIQALVRRVRGTKWLSEELPAWMAKGRHLPRP
jgi:hypothetical protein